MIAVTSGPEHRFIEMNAGYEEFTGRPDLPGLTLLEAFPDMAGSGVQQRLDQVYRTGEPYAASEERILVAGPDGEPVEVYRNLIYKATRDAEGQVTGVFILAHDVTELVQGREQLNRRQQELEQLNEELRAAYDTTIEGWARALDLKDHDTEGHSRRVTDLTVALARQLGYPEGEIVHLRRGALLHDIGKIGIPESILRKPGKLNEEEWALMQEHPNLAKKVLSEIPFLQPALDIPLYHHEKWDGSGYPNGLQGEEIPLAARMFAVIDVYDALVNDRPYRLAMDRGEALEIIEDQAGQHFDPRVVAAFLALI
jgi:HD-GYP domain-containing protein (c-di-GMP phosphodiesterase class II)